MKCEDRKALVTGRYSTGTNYFDASDIEQTGTFSALEYADPGGSEKKEKVRDSLFKIAVNVKSTILVVIAADTSDKSVIMSWENYLVRNGFVDLVQVERMRGSF